MRKIQNIERNCSLIAETFMVLLGSLLLQHHIFISEAVVEQTAGSLRGRPRLVLLVVCGNKIAVLSSDFFTLLS